MRIVRTLVCSLGLFVAAAFGADVTGKWTGDMPGRGGDTTPTTFTFKAEGDKLTGSMTGPQGDIAIKDGKVAGDQISFTTTLEFGGNSIKLVYKGTVAGEQIKMTREREGSGQPREFTIKRSGT
jgi:hypothetical protein